MYGRSDRVFYCLGFSCEERRGIQVDFRGGHWRLRPQWQLASVLVVVKGPPSWNERCVSFCFGLMLFSAVASVSLVVSRLLFCRHSFSSVSVSALLVSLSLVLSGISAISLLSGGALLALVTPAGSSSHYVASFVLSHHQPCSSSSVSVLPVSLSLVLSGISAIFLLSGGASSALVTPDGDSSRYVASFVLFHVHSVLSLLYQSACFWCCQGILQYPF